MIGEAHGQTAQAPETGANGERLREVSPGSKRSTTTLNGIPVLASDDLGGDFRAAFLDPASSGGGMVLRYRSGDLVSKKGIKPINGGISVVLKQAAVPR